MQLMPAFPPRLDSLRSKILFGYAAIILLIAGLSAFSFLDMRLLETQLASGERIGQFLGIALEIRRFEKNYFLYGQETDRRENRTYVEKARRLLADHEQLFATLDSPARAARLREVLDEYERLMAGHGAGSDPQREARIREAGKEIVTAAEAWATAERNLLQRQLDRHRSWLIGSIIAVIILAIGIGHLLARRVVRPLKELEEAMTAVGAGQLGGITMKAPDREIASLTHAFNRVLHELDLRQGQLVRSEKLAALGTLLSGVAHEVNNPLSNISTSCEILTEELGDAATSFQKELLDQIGDETWRARRIVRALLDYARDRQFRREPISLAALADDTLRLLRGQLPAQVAIRASIPPALVIEGDRQRLQQALFNLVGNAVDALDGAGEVVIAGRVADQPLPSDAMVFGRLPEEPTVEIEVRDNGHGIDPQALPRIFDPFFTTKEVGKGSGLGLFIVFEIVEEHGGCIAVRSRPGQGASFLLRLPVHKETHD